MQKYSSTNFKLTTRALKILESKPDIESIPKKCQYQLSTLIGAKGGDLNSLDFTNSEMGDIGIHYLAHFLGMTRSVKELKLNNCKITDDGLSILCKSMLKFHIGVLHLKENLITIKGLFILKQCIIFKIKAREIMES